MLSVNALIVRITTDASNFVAGMRTVEQRFASTAQYMQNVGRNLTLAVTVPLTLMGRAAVKAGADFEEAAARVQGSGNLTREQMDKVGASALGMAEKLGVSPTKAITGFGNLIKAGVGVESAIGGVGEAALQLGKVGQLTGDKSEGMLVKFMNVFKNDGMSAAEAVDVISASADSSTISIAQLGQSIQQGAAIWGIAGYKAKEFAGVIAQLGNSGVVGSDAGTSAKSFMTFLTDKTHGERIKKFGIDVKDASGKMLPMRDIIGQMEQKFGKLNQAARLKALNNLFGTDGGRAAAILLQDGVAGYDKIQNSMKGAMSVSEKFEMILNTFNGQWERTLAIIETLQVQIGYILMPYLRALNDVIVQAVQWWNSLNVTQKSVSVVLGLVAAAIGPVIYGMIYLGAMIASIGTAFITFLGVGLAVLDAFALALSWPLVLLAAGIVLVTAFFTALVVAGTIAVAWFVGTDGLIGMWNTVTEAAYSFFVYTLAWLTNFQQNWGILTEWLSLNWYNLFMDMGKAYVQFYSNMIMNLFVVLKTLMRLFAAFGGWLAGQWDKMFTISFIVAVYQGINMAIDALVGFGETMYKILTTAAIETGTMMWKLITNPRQAVTDMLFGKDKKKFQMDLPKDFNQGRANNNNLLGTMGNILGEEFKNLKGPLDGFKSSLTEGPAFNTNAPWIAKMFGAGPKGSVIKMPENNNPNAGKGGFGEGTPELPEGGLDFNTKGEKNKVGTTFGQYSLKTHILDGPGIKPFDKKQEVSAPGVETRLDKLIERANLTQNGVPIVSY